MPELPEVEAARRLAEPVLVGHTVTGVHCADDPIVYDGVTPRRFAAALRGRTVLSMHRHGKQMWMELDRPPHPTLHLGMTGAFRVLEADDEVPRFAKLTLTADTSLRLCMTNKRRLGRIRLQVDPPNEPPISRLGPDPLLDMPGAAWLTAQIQRRRAPIKAVLLDQQLLAGVGNWIADEVLYQAKIDPHRLGCELTDREIRRLRTRLGAIIRKAVDVHADSTKFPAPWLFHHRWRKRADATTAKGESIVHDTIAGRTTAWVPTVQT